MWLKISSAKWRKFRLSSLCSCKIVWFIGDHTRCQYALDTMPRTVASRTWWRHDAGTLSALLALCERNPLVTGGFPSQRASNGSFDVFFCLSLNNQLHKMSICRWFETEWRSCDITEIIRKVRSMAAPRKPVSIIPILLPPLPFNCQSIVGIPSMLPA